MCGQSTGPPVEVTLSTILLLLLIPVARLRGTSRVKHVTISNSLMLGGKFSFTYLGKQQNQVDIHLHRLAMTPGQQKGYQNQMYIMEICTFDVFNCIECTNGSRGPGAAGIFDPG